jgi:hypothetical protein
MIDDAPPSRATRTDSPQSNCPPSTQVAGDRDRTLTGGAAEDVAHLVAKSIAGQEVHDDQSAPVRCVDQGCPFHPIRPFRPVSRRREQSVTVKALRLFR